MSVTRRPLTAKRRPTFEKGTQTLRLVDLFAGCGGLTLGVAQAARKHKAALSIPLAVDFDESATTVYRSNFVDAKIETDSVEKFFDGGLCEDLSVAETAVVDRVGTVDVLVGGPPCQGHSDLNNHTRRADPKNALYLRMARAVEVLRPKIVLIENVPAVTSDRGRVVERTTAHLSEIGYDVAEGVVRMDSLGVAQTRKRHIVLATRVSAVDVGTILDGLINRPHAADADLESAIGDLKDIREPTGYDVPPRASALNQKRMAYLLEHDLYDLPNTERPICHQDDHSYKSMYGRLHWKKPAQTITSGFGSIGQGRYMHPDHPRALTPHEAARLQGFPDYFDFSSVNGRGALATMIGNAVPPALARQIMSTAIPALRLPRCA